MVLTRYDLFAATTKEKSYVAYFSVSAIRSCVKPACDTTSLSVFEYISGGNATRTLRSLAYCVNVDTLGAVTQFGRFRSDSVVQLMLW